jgi:8-oxo-dGTP diphosphatase
VITLAFTPPIYQSNDMTSSQNIEKNKIIDVVALALRDSETGHYLLARRKKSEAGAGAWEFPGGKVELGETQQQALVREIQEELGLNLSAAELSFVAENTHDYGHRPIRIFLWQHEQKGRPEVTLVDHDKVGWYSLDEMWDIPLSEGDKPFISLLKSV